jgi:mono/diheme cytochrome c family protein
MILFGPAMRQKIYLQHSGLALFAAVGFVSCGVAGFSWGQTPPRPEPTPEQATFFETKIRPVLAKNCYGCHGPTTQIAGLRLDTADALTKGGDKGPTLVGSDPEKSLLVHVVRYTGPVNMPPAGRLKPNEIADLEAWVKMGAPWPKSPTVKRRQDEFLWSLQPVKKPAVPKVKNVAWAKNPIDAFILARLEARHLSPSAPADRRTLLRRVTYDLTGLPPSAAETDAFVADKSPTAYEKVVDRLLASPRYGERWARQWLDVARYADTKGYVFEEDRNYPNAYNYREWVINAFNRDLPYDQFVTQQLAADRVTDANADDHTPLAALGFLTLGRRFLNDTPSIIDDRIDVAMRGFQGFTVACARCHDHKFDPIPTQDYYSLYAVFNSSEERTVPISSKAIREPWEKFNARIAADEAVGREIIVSQTKRLRGLSGLSNEVKGVLASIREEAVPQGDNLNKLLPAFEPEPKARLVAAMKDIDDAKKTPPPTPELAMSMVDRGNGSDGVVFKRGNPGSPGDPAPRRFLLALCASKEREHWTAGSGRLELAKSIASKDNPLTARVFVNRIWMGHFGAGIVRTPSDFGHQGEKPTHPELLDYLAATFTENGWSIKKLHRQMVLSATYRQSSDVTVAAMNADPDNRLLNRMNRRRLDLEQMRDTLMAASGRLDLNKVGGRSVDLWSQPFTPRRAVYGFIERQNLPGIFRTFDFASPDSTSARRFQTTVPQQALFFLNSPLAVDSARNVASRPELNGSDDAQRVRRIYRLLFDRLPDADEAAAGVAYLREGSPTALRAGVWQYGYGSFANGKVGAFTPLAFFGDGMYRVGSVFPDQTLGYITLNAQGGHPGHDGAHAVIRRWVAPASMSVTVKGQLGHPAEQGDGVRGRLVSSRSGVLGEWSVRHGMSRTDVGPFSVQKGDTLDFVVDPVTNDGYDAFAWAPTVTGVGSWDAATNFAGPPAPPLSRLTLYVQALMMTNEFVFVD